VWPLDHPNKIRVPTKYGHPLSSFDGGCTTTFFLFCWSGHKAISLFFLKNKNKNLSKKLVSMLQQITVCFFKISIFRSRLVCEIDPWNGLFKTLTKHIQELNDLQTKVNFWYKILGG
jgi:hypothetical protein